MEKTGIPREDVAPKPVKQAGDRESRFVGDSSITEQVLEKIAAPKKAKETK